MTEVFRDIDEASKCDICLLWKFIKCQRSALLSLTMKISVDLNDLKTMHLLLKNIYVKLFYYYVNVNVSVVNATFYDTKCDPLN